jgi:hypothetical protein
MSSIKTHLHGYILRPQKHNNLRSIKYLNHISMPLSLELQPKR